MSNLQTRITKWLTERLIAPSTRYSPLSFTRRALFQPLTKELVLEAAIDFQASNNVHGDYLEFGVFQGQSLMHAYLYGQYLTTVFDSGTVPILRGASAEALHKSRFFAFDSFQGLPEPAPHDVVAEQPDWFPRGGFACSQDQFEQNLVRNGVDMSRVEIVPGWYQDTLTSETKKTRGLEAAAVVHVDCDFYESAVLVLDFITDLLVDGSVIIFDDWYVYRGRPDRGEQRAFREWLARNPSIRATEYVKLATVSFIIHRD